MVNHGIRHQADLIITEPYTATFSLALQRLQHTCRFEKGGHCRRAKGRCEAQNCPQTPKTELRPFLTILGTRDRSIEKYTHISSEVDSVRFMVVNDEVLIEVLPMPAGIGFSTTGIIARNPVLVHERVLAFDNWYDSLPPAVSQAVGT